MQLLLAPNAVHPHTSKTPNQLNVLVVGHANRTAVVTALAMLTPLQAIPNTPPCNISTRRKVGLP